MQAFIPAISLHTRPTSPPKTSPRHAHTPTATMSPLVSRRAVLQMVAAAALAATTMGDVGDSRAAVALGDLVEDSVNGYTFRTPGAGWAKQVASLSSGRTATIFLRDADQDSNISMVSTPVASDFQKLASFGTMENVLSTLIPDKKGDVEGNVISAERDAKKNAYVVEYTISSKGVKRHLLTVFSLQPGRSLVTLTGQALEESWAQVEPVVRAVVDSYSIVYLD